MTSTNNGLVFIDTNILLDVILPNRPRYEKTAKYIASEPGLAISALSVHLAVHFGQKFSLRPVDVRSGLSGLKILALDRGAVIWAFENLADNDFEDALQVACAVLAGCDEFVTFDESLAKSYSPFIKMKLL